MTPLDASARPANAGSEPAQYTLPNGVTIYHANKHETDFLYKELFVEEAYFKHGIKLEAGAVVFDIGANIGMFSLLVKKRCPSASVHAFEPTPELFHILTLNLEPYKESAHPHQCGVSDHDGQATFTYYPDYSIMSGFHADAAGDSEVLASGIRNQFLRRPARGGEIPAEYIDRMVEQKLGTKRELAVPLRSISSLLREGGIDRIDLLKIDAERSELPILRGIEADDWARILQIVLEVHDAPGLKIVQELLREKGFRTVVEQEGQFAESGVFNCFAIRV